jgi:hypothetical protein
MVSFFLARLRERIEVRVKVVETAETLTRRFAAASPRGRGKIGWEWADNVLSLVVHRRFLSFQWRITNLTWTSWSSAAATRDCVLR